MNSLSERLVQTKLSKSNSTFEYDVMLNGKIIGYVSSNNVEQLTEKLRYLKALASVSSSTTDGVVPKYLEICHLPQSSYSLYPGLFLFTTPGRMMRPTRNLQTHDIEYIGTLEQCYLHVIINPEEFIENVNCFILIKTHKKQNFYIEIILKNKENNTSRTLSLFFHECYG